MIIHLPGILYSLNLGRDARRQVASERALEGGVPSGASQIGWPGRRVSGCVRALVCFCLFLRGCGCGACLCAWVLGLRMFVFEYVRVPLRVSVCVF